ncbi:MAG: hypothetical protein ACI9NN_001786, partial [Bacteroidia bacterium]
PFCIWLLEKDEPRKKTLLVITFIGGATSLLLGYVIVFIGVKAEILDCSIVYNFDINKSVYNHFGLLYLAVTILPTLISRIKKVWVLGAVNLVVYLFTKLNISDRTLSIWCLFATISSMWILWIILDLRKKQAKQDVTS